MRERGDVHLNHVELALELGVSEFSAECKAGVVDEGVDLDVLIEQKIEDRLRRIRNSQIGGEDVRFDVELSFELTRGGLESIALSGDEDEIESISSEDLGELEPDTA